MKSLKWSFLFSLRLLALVVFCGKGMVFSEVSGDQHSLASVRILLGRLKFFHMVARYFSCRNIDFTSPINIKLRLTLSDCVRDIDLVDAFIS